MRHAHPIMGPSDLMDPCWTRGNEVECLGDVFL